MVSHSSTALRGSRASRRPGGAVALSQADVRAAAPATSARAALALSARAVPPVATTMGSLPPRRTTKGVKGGGGARVQREPSLSQCSVSQSGAAR